MPVSEVFCRLLLLSGVASTGKPALGNLYFGAWAKHGLILKDKPKKAKTSKIAGRHLTKFCRFSEIIKTMYQNYGLCKTDTSLL